MGEIKFRIGMDIGGTNTDAVLVDGSDTIVAAVKKPTTRDIAGGVAAVLSALMTLSGVSTSQVRAVYLGTTHATNAILQQRDLFKVGLIRLAGQRPDSLPPCYNWPLPLREALFAGAETINGGYECHGGPITPFSSKEASVAIRRLVDQGAESMAIVGVFSPLSHQQEIECAEVCADTVGSGLPISLSHQLGGIGFIERENTTILNAALKKVMAQGFRDIEAVLQDLQLFCPLFITQNNGCIIDLQQAIEMPVLTISAGPTNSFVGASRLLGIQEAVIVDIGGTSTDVGMVRKGFPKRSLNTSDIGGVRLNFPMPDVLSIALGGGSYVDLSKELIGPQSAGMNILSEALCFGGDQLTLTDVALATGEVSIDRGVQEPDAVSQDMAYALMNQAFLRIQREVALMDAGDDTLPVILVGGGAAIMPKGLLTGRYIVPANAGVANAFGAALAEVSGTIDTVVSLANRESVLQLLQEQAIEKAIEKGAANDNVRIVDVQIIPYHYMPDHLARVTVVAAGRQQS